ncbi:hypothetical protein EJ07DRAFT_168718 [Lizonia empirigonia]|nr:hypothetical protein EJ07DRAFT_168718 [Lizonia empirigonia]
MKSVLGVHGGLYRVNFSGTVVDEKQASNFWTESNGFQPADILSRRATSGMFSLQNVLSTQHADTSEGSTQALSVDDPIEKGLVNLQVATSLFDGFMKHLNPFVSQLDPCLHTLDYVRQTSSFLFVVILAAASKLLHVSLFPPLYSHAEGLLLESFRRGSKSVEVIQALLILTYWKKPDDSRAWLSVGYAIRMALELGWHQLGSDKMRCPSDMPQLQARKQRNVERTWLVLFVYDRSISLQTGKPCMIERSSYIESASDWYRHHLAIANDRLLCAFVSLRLITSTHSDTMTSQSVQHQCEKALQFRSLLRLLDRQIKDWQNSWTEAIAGDGEDCHAFLIPFYGSYARLLLFTSPLRASLRLNDIVTAVDTEAIWNSCLSALDMLKLVSETSTSQLLYFAQDSIHVMIAYATVFLIKLLVSAPTYIRTEMETAALNAIRSAMRTFSEKRAPANTGCALQAKFLRNVLLEYETINARSQRSGTQPRSDQHSHQNHNSLRSAHDDESSFPATSHDPSVLNLDFANDDVWALIFANAGFNIDQGTFLLSA